MGPHIIMKTFGKTYLSPASLVRLLESRGLIVNDRKKAECFLDNISYYRLSAYMYPFLSFPKEHHIFKYRASFDKVLNLYRFDKKLKVFLFNEIEKIEVAFRCALVNIVCEETGDPFWITNPVYFRDPHKYRKTLALIRSEFENSSEEFVIHFRVTYSDPYPPAWMLLELLPLGVATRIYVNLSSNRIKKLIAQRFGLQVKPFESWMTVVTLTRNACCHHARVWNKQNTSVPNVPIKISRPWITLQTDPMRIYFDMCIIKFFVNIISPQNDMKNKLLTLLSQYPKVDMVAMGFPPAWQNEPVWK